MFVLSELSETIRIPPHRFAHETDAIIAEINKRFANKVIPDVGLGITLFDILSVSDGVIYPGDGASHVKVEFRMVVFRPFIDEIIVGWVKSSTPEGIRVSLDFFEDIFIPPSLMQEPSKFNEEEQLWVWQYGEHELFIELKEKIRFKVDTLQFNPPGPQDFIKGSAAAMKKPLLTAQVTSTTAVADQLPTVFDHLQAPMVVIGSINNSGLGLVSWWQGSGSGHEEPEEKEKET